MKAIRKTTLYYCFVICILLAAVQIDFVTSFQTTGNSLTKTSAVANPNHEEWTRQRWRWNLCKDPSRLGKHWGIDDSLGMPEATRKRQFRLELSKSSNFGSDGEPEPNSNADSKRLLRFSLFAGVGILYWYLLVLGAAAKANGLPVPDAIPMIPGWPVSDADLAPVLEDSYHFFYLADLLHTPDAPAVSPPRLAVFNLVEAWIFAMLPALWKDVDRRLPRPVLLVTWLALGINLTNAFLAPYLALTELRGNRSSSRGEPASSASRVPKNSIVAGVFAAIALAVVGHALSESVTVATASDWSAFVELAKNDRSYLAFCVDPVLFALFQPFLLARIKTENPTTASLEPLDYVPFVGLMLWLLAPEKDEPISEPK